ncbi:hypothetical protein BGZ83_004099, partial [Gryganskiella cystojenkinii]
LGPAPSKTNHKFAPPDKFDGKRDGFACLAWLHAVTFYNDCIQADKKQHSRIAIGYLTGEAILWWNGSGLSPVILFPDFEDGLKAMFVPVRARLHSVKLCNRSVAAPVQEMQLYIDTLTPVNGDAAARTELEKSKQVKDQAVYNGNIFHVGMTPNTSTANNPAVTALAAQSAQPILDPNAMDIDNLNLGSSNHLAAFLNNVSIQVNNRLNDSNFSNSNNINNNNSRHNNRNNNQKNNNSNNKDIAKITQEEKAYLDSVNGCYRCRVPNAGHYARDCPDPKTRSFNNLSMTTENSPFSDESGKVASTQESSRA